VTLADKIAEIASIVILATAIFLYIKGGYEASTGAVICLIVVLGSFQYRARQRENMRNGKEILSQYKSPRT
jgi:hypothetical protein